MVHGRKTSRSALKERARKKALIEGRRILELGMSQGLEVTPHIERKAAELFYRQVRLEQKRKAEAVLAACSEVAQMEPEETPAKLWALLKAIYETSITKSVEAISFNDLGTDLVFTA
jgi:hypothetical protein